jgi:hypothetical protein
VDASPESLKSSSGAGSHFPSKQQQLTNIAMDDIIKLNVGGQLFITTRATLCAKAGSMLAAKFDPNSNVAPSKNELDGAVFLDRNPKTFEHVLCYLRHGCQGMSNIPDELLNELRADAVYFGLIGLKQACDTEKQSNTTSEENMEYKAFRGIVSFTGESPLEKLALEMNDGWRVEEKISEYAGSITRNMYMLSRPRHN